MRDEYPDLFPGISSGSTGRFDFMRRPPGRGRPLPDLDFDVGAELPEDASPFDDMEEMDAEEMESEGFFSDDPEVMDMAEANIEVGPNGGLCYECIHFTPPDGCTGYQPDPDGPPMLTVNPDMISSSTAFRPSIADQGSRMPAEEEMDIGWPDDFEDDYEDMG